MVLLLGSITTAWLFIGGCHSRPSSSPDLTASTVDEAAAGSVMMRTELYFGLSRAGGDEITPEQFSAFVAEVITPRFPDGLTIVDASGQWRDSSGNVTRERSKILIVLHAPGAESARAIEEIRDQYKSRFGQESVMRVNSMARVAF
jgi:hypothetical protein